VLRRDGAQLGDDIWVTGTLGDAAGALAPWRAGQAVEPHLRARLDRPTPRIATGLALAGIASAAIDISDGLLADLGHVCAASGIGAEVALDALPASAALRAAFGDASRCALQASGGDDYELCFTAAPQARAALARIAAQSDTALTRIGRLVTGAGVQALTADGVPWMSARTGYTHFAD
jgi:thiamine-monophosphate kinase